MSQDKIRIIAMRHGEAVHNLADQLSSDMSDKWSLTEEGKQQTYQTALKLKREGIAHIICSPFPRTQQTAKIIAKEIGLKEHAIEMDERLGEPFFGDMEGKTYDEFFSLFGSHREALLFGPPGGESGVVIFRRVSECLNDIAANQKYAGKTILLVTHGFIICQLYRYFQKPFTDILPQAGYEIFCLNIKK
jgi:broad specificity phosphatase PhoE